MRKNKQPQAPLDDAARAELSRFVLHDLIDGLFAKPRRIVEWVRETVEHADILANEPSAPRRADATLFWIRLRGVLAEVEPWIEDRHAGINEPDAEIAFDDPRYEIADRMVERMRALRAAFTDNELMWIEYVRHVELSNGDIRRTFDSKVLGRIATLREFAIAIEDVEAKHGTKDHAAVALATKSAGHLHALLDALRAWHNAN